MSGLKLVATLHLCACRHITVRKNLNTFKSSRPFSIYPVVNQRWKPNKVEHTSGFSIFSVLNKRWKSTKVDTASGFEDLDKPIKYTTSKAAEWTAENTHGGNDKDMPWFQPYVVCGSTAAVLIYFCILREESDVDEEMGKTLWERVPGLERQQLEVVLKYNIDHGLPTQDIRDRMEIVRKRDEELLKAQQLSKSK